MNTNRLYCLVLDLGYPMDQQTLGHILTALENILILASSSKHHYKSTSITISTVNQDAHNLGVFPVRGDLKNIQTLIGNLRSTARSNWRLSSEEYEDFLQLALTTAMNEYKLKVHNHYGSKSGKLRIAVLSSKPGRTLGRVLSSIRRRWTNLKVDGAVAEASDIVHIQVIDTSVRGGGNVDWPVKSASDALDCLDESFLQPKIIIQRAPTPLSIQDEMKRFLMIPDPQVVKLVISAEAITSTKTADAVDDSGTMVLCEATPVTLDPLDLPASVANNFLITPAKDDEEDKSHNDFEPPDFQVVIRTLVIKSRVSYDGVSDGSTFGMPYYLSPISFETAAAMTAFLGSKTNVNIDENIEMFWAVHQLLTEREEVLLTTLESSLGTGGNFLIHAGGDCLLLQAIRSVELALPASTQASGSIRKNVSAHMVVRAENILDPLPRQEYYRPSDYSTGVFSHLSSILKGNVQKSVTRKKNSAMQNNLILSYVNSRKELSSKSDKK